MVNLSDGPRDMAGASSSSSGRRLVEDRMSRTQVVFPMDCHRNQPHKARSRTPEESPQLEQQRQNGSSPMRRRVEKLVDRSRSPVLDQYDATADARSVKGERPAAVCTTQENGELSGRSASSLETRKEDALEVGGKDKGPATEDSLPENHGNNPLAQTSNSYVMQWLANTNDHELEAPVDLPVNSPANSPDQSDNGPSLHTTDNQPSASSIMLKTYDSVIEPDNDAGLECLDIEVDEGYINENGNSVYLVDEYTTATLNRLKVRSMRRHIQLPPHGPSSTDPNSKCHKPPLVKRPTRMRRRKDISVQNQAATRPPTEGDASTEQDALN